jgi:hypothetical protein
MNEALFRAANERAADWEERDSRDAELFHCECADLDCRDKVEVTGEAYERVRSDATHFLALPGHEIPDVESVVEKNDGWIVIEKAPETHPIAESTDPRS